MKYFVLSMAMLFGCDDPRRPKLNERCTWLPEEVVVQDANGKERRIALCLLGDGSVTWSVGRQLK